MLKIIGYHRNQQVLITIKEIKIPYNFASDKQFFKENSHSPIPR